MRAWTHLAALLAVLALCPLAGATPAYHAAQGSGGVTTTGGMEILLCDLDADGDLDLVVSQPGVVVPLAWHENTGFGGGFSSVSAPSGSLGRVMYNAHRAAAGDLDGDGHIDVVAAGQPQQGWSNTSTSLVWFSNEDGTGGFPSEPRVIGRDGKWIEDIFVADADNDGDLDVFAVYTDESAFMLFENEDGRGTFAEGRAVGDVVHPSTVWVADLDGDGCVDVVWGRRVAGERVRWLRGHCDGHFSLGTDLGTHDGVSLQIRAVDLDQDGAVDVLFSSGDALMLARNQGGGEFASPVVVASFNGTNVTNIAVADLDGDRDTDVLVAAGRSVFALYTEQPSRLQLSLPVYVATGLHDPQEVYAGDVDGDGVSDLRRCRVRGRRSVAVRTITSWQLTPSRPSSP